MTGQTANQMLENAAQAIPGLDRGRLRLVGEGDLPSVFCVTDLAVASIAAAGLAAAGLTAALDGRQRAVTVDRRLASFWFGTSLRPQGWQPPPPWDPVAGDYRAADGWIRLHTNAPRHREAALSVLGVAGERSEVARAVAGREAEGLEAEIVAQGGCAAKLRSRSEWVAMPAGRSLAGAPLVAWESPGKASPLRVLRSSAKPLTGLRLLDMTRVLAGPVATRFLASLGADVLRIDPPDWDEPGVVPEVMAGKRSARLDLRSEAGRRRFEGLLKESHLLLHGYRHGALEGLGYGAEQRRAINPALIEVSLNAYGWSGPWQYRRGFDSLVQMSCGIAEAGMRLWQRDRPTPLPVQALDQATGYLMAAAALSALESNLLRGEVKRARLSLARTANWLMQYPADALRPLAPERSSDLGAVEKTYWGPARRLKSPLAIEGLDLDQRRPAAPLGRHRAVWLKSPALSPR